MGKRFLAVWMSLVISVSLCMQCGPAVFAAEPAVKYLNTFDPDVFGNWGNGGFAGVTDAAGHENNGVSFQLTAWGFSEAAIAVEWDMSRLAGGGWVSMWIKSTAAFSVILRGGNATVKEVKPGASADWKWVKYQVADLSTVDKVRVSGQGTVGTASLDDFMITDTEPAEPGSEPVIPEDAEYQNTFDPDVFGAWSNGGFQGVVDAGGHEENGLKFPVSGYGFSQVSLPDEWDMSRLSGGGWISMWFQGTVPFSVMLRSDSATVNENKPGASPEWKWIKYHVDDLSAVTTLRVSGQNAAGTVLLDDFTISSKEPEEPGGENPPPTPPAGAVNFLNDFDPDVFESWSKSGATPSEAEGHGGQGKQFAIVGYGFSEAALPQQWDVSGQKDGAWVSFWVKTTDQPSFQFSVQLRSGSGTVNEYKPSPGLDWEWVKYKVDAIADCKAIRIAGVNKTGTVVIDDLAITTAEPEKPGFDPEAPVRYKNTFDPADDFMGAGASWVCTENSSAADTPYGHSGNGKAFTLAAGGNAMIELRKTWDMTVLPEEGAWMSFWAKDTDESIPSNYRVSFHFANEKNAQINDTEFKATLTGEWTWYKFKTGSGVLGAKKFRVKNMDKRLDPCNLVIDDFMVTNQEPQEPSGEPDKLEVKSVQLMQNGAALDSLSAAAAGEAAFTATIERSGDAVSVTMMVGVFSGEGKLLEQAEIVRKNISGTDALTATLHFDAPPGELSAMVFLWDDADSMHPLQDYEPAGF